MPDNSFKEFLLDQLAALPAVRTRAMFGAHGVWQGEHFFGILDEGRLYFKVDESNRKDYEARGMGPFTYEAKGETMTLGYYEAPPEVLESAADLVDWARKSIKVAAAKKMKPAAKKSPSRAGRRVRKQPAS